MKAFYMFDVEVVVLCPFTYLLMEKKRHDSCFGSVVWVQLGQEKQYNRAHDLGSAEAVEQWQLFSIATWLIIASRYSLSLIEYLYRTHLDSRSQGVKILGGVIENYGVRWMTQTSVRINIYKEYLFPTLILCIFFLSTIPSRIMICRVGMFASLVSFSVKRNNLAAIKLWFLTIISF